MKIIKKYWLNPCVNYAVMSICCNYVIHVDVGRGMFWGFIGLISIIINGLTFWQALKLFQKKLLCLIVSFFMYATVLLIGGVILLIIGDGTSFNNSDGWGEGILIMFFEIMFMISLFLGNVTAYIINIIARKRRKEGSSPALK